MPGFEANVRQEYFDNTDLRTGSHHADRAAFALPNDEEVQKETLNRNTWFGFDYVAKSPWALRVEIPYENRYHSTVVPGDTELSESRANGLGDVRVLARYDRFSMYRSWGVQFGLKLPTGGFSQNFATGPAAGTPLDRGLQLGSGTTDLLAGLSYFRRPIPQIGCFAQLLAQQPLAERRGFIPGGSIGCNLGIRYLNESRVTPQLQVNAKWEAREHGMDADTANSGATLIYLSPGVTLEVNDRSTAFLFVQLPVLQRVNGLQLEPHALISAGFTWRL
jgi:hypothetical protein